MDNRFPPSSAFRQGSGKEPIPGPARPRILVVQPYLPSYRWGFFRELAKSLNARLGFLLLRPGKQPDLPEDLRGLLLTAGDAPLGLGQALAVARSFGPDAVLLPPTPQTPLLAGLALWCRFRGVGLALWHKGRSPLRPGGGHRQRMVRLLLRAAGLGVHAVVGYGRDSADYFQKAGIPRDKIFVAQNTVDTAEIMRKRKWIQERARQIRRELNLEGRKVLLALGSLKPAKRMDLALDCFDKLRRDHPDLTLLMVGSGPEQDALEQRVARLGPHCHMLGRVPLFEDNAYIAASDLFLVTASAGLAINQAILLGCPVVCADEPGADAELVRHGISGLRFKANDPGALELAVRRMLDEPGLAGRMAQGGLQEVSRAGIENMVAGMSAALRRCLAKR